MTVGRWADHAICKGQTDLFFPDQGDSKSFQEAAAICAVCPVLDECRAHGIENAERFGVWGGLNAVARIKIRNPRVAGAKRYTCGTHRSYNDGCRCDLCKDFYNASQRAIRARKKNLRTSVAPGTHTLSTPNK
jgi:WhiB family redox-sensing transcriptional regulator